MALVRLVLGLDRSKWEPHVFCLGNVGALVEQLTSQNIEVTCYEARSALDVPNVLWRLTKALRKLRPQILQTFLFHANIIGRIAGKFAGVPHIVSGIRVAEKQKRWHLLLDRVTNPLVALNVCVSNGVAEFAEKQGKLNRKKIAVIPNSVDPSLFENAQKDDLSRFGIPNDATVCLTVARLTIQKGIDVLLSAIPIIINQHPECHFLIIGDGDARPNLETQASKLGIAGHVHFGGFQRETAPLLAASNAFILPSRWEGMSNALLEAMAAGLPIIATAVEGTTELIQDKVNGFLVPPEDSGCLAASICSILNDKTSAKRMAHTAQQYVKLRHTTESVVKSYSDLYTNLLNSDGI